MGTGLMGAPLRVETMSSLEKRKRFRQLTRDSPRLPFRGDPRRVDGTTMASGRFDLVDDEVVATLFQHLAALPPGPRTGLALRDAIRGTVVAAAAFAGSCRRMNTVLCTIAVGVRKELVARATTQIVPRGLSVGQGADFGALPFTRQVEDETRSSDQLALLRVAVDGLATHCGMAHCRSYRKSLNRDLKRGALGPPRPSVVVAAYGEKTHTLTATPVGSHAFAAVRRAVPVCIDVNDAPRTRCTEDVLVRKTVGAPGVLAPGGVEELSVSLDACHGETGAPYGVVEHMAADSSGEWVAFVRSVLETDELDTPFAELALWRAGEPTTSKRVHPPGAALAVGAVNPQAIWWMRHPADTRDDFPVDALVVLWSTCYVHEMGGTVGQTSSEWHYVIATYDVINEHAAGRAAWLEDASGVFDGKALVVSPRTDGLEVAVLAHTRSPTTRDEGGAGRETFLHAVGNERRSAVVHSPNVGDGAREDAALAHVVAVGFAPSGDALVAVHRHPDGVCLEVLVRTAEEVFVSAHVLDVTHHVWGGSPEASVFDDDPEAIGLVGGLRVPFSIVFSPCGRFAALVDQRPKWHLRITNHALVVVDMAMRHVSRGVRALPLASVDDVAPRALHWTQSGIWITARHGALVLWAP